MSIKIAVPEGKYINNLIANIDAAKNKYNLELIYAKEKDIPQLLLNKSADLSIMNPLNYGKLLETEPFRMLPTTCINALGFSRLATISFKEDLMELKKIAAPDKDSFLAIATKIIYDEKYDFGIKLVELSKEEKKSSISFDAELSYEENIEYPSTMDLTEEWSDNFNYAMPIAFWVISESADVELMKNITQELILKDLPNPQVIHEHYHRGAISYERQGLIQWQFSPELEKAIDDTLELLFQLNYLTLLSDSHIAE
ncbi:MAG: MqnA/MqnD/SBP family protein [Chloroherpetonaceae bacterium]